MIYFILTALLLGFSTGLSAAIYRGVLAYEPILNWWFRFGNRYENKWFFRPVWGCLKCIAGQLALWFYLIFLETGAISTQLGQGVANGTAADSFAAGLATGLFGLILVISASIFTAINLAPVIHKLQNE